jgi:hypothetical protein
MEMGETTAEADEKILQPSPGGPRHLVASRRTRGAVLEAQASDDGLHIFTQHW